MAADGAREWFRSAGRRLLRAERREVRAFRRWIETTSNLVHLTVLIAIPLLLGAVTALAQAVEFLPFLLFPPLASGSYTLFSDPEGRQASPRRFIGGLTAGAFCGWLALAATSYLYYGVSPAAYTLNAGAVALGLFLTGAVTWLLDMEEASAFATALLIHVTGVAQFTYVLSVAVSSTLVAGVFTLWREYVYEERAEFLYESTKGDDHVLVPMRGGHQAATAVLAGRLAAAHDAGKVVLLDIVADDDTAREKRNHLDADWTDDEQVEPGDVSQQWAEIERTRRQDVADSVADLKAESERVETTVGVPCEVVVAVGRGSLSRTIGQAATETNCDLIATPYETEDDRLATYIRELFRGDTDVLVHRSYDGRTRWKRVMVPVRKAGAVAHNMLDFAARLVGSTGSISVSHCISTENDRREAERMLADLAETVPESVETRVARANIHDFLSNNAEQYDLIILGASQDRSTVSRFVKPPTFEELATVDTDVAIVDRNY